MKSYKDINEKIEVSQQVKANTLRAMQKESSFHKHRTLRYVGACIFIFVVCGLVISLQGKQVDNKGNLLFSTNDSNKTKSFQLSDYLIDDQIDNEMTGDIKIQGVIAGGVEDMYEALRNELFFVPDKEDLVLPNGYDVSVQFKQYVYEDIGPYAIALYHASKDDMYSLDFSVEDQRIPDCYITLEQANLKKYKDYQIAIHHEIDEQGKFLYWFYGLRDHYEIQGFALMEKETDFVKFLESFLQ